MARKDIIYLGYLPPIVCAICTVLNLSHPPMARDFDNVIHSSCCRIIRVYNYFLFSIWLPLYSIVKLNFSFQPSVIWTLVCFRTKSTVLMQTTLHGSPKKINFSHCFCIGVGNDTSLPPQIVNETGCN